MSRERFKDIFGEPGLDQDCLETCGTPDECILNGCQATAEKQKRHSWSEPVRFPFKSERSCRNVGCPIVKVTRHDGGGHWVEWYRANDDGVAATRIPGDTTPACEGVA